MILQKMILLLLRKEFFFFFNSSSGDINAMWLRDSTNQGKFKFIKIFICNSLALFKFYFKR